MNVLPASMATQLVHDMLARRHVGWSIGCGTAVADFLHVDGDPDPEVRASERGGSVLTARGALVVDLPPTARVIAYETPSEQSGSWLQAAAFCLPAGPSAMGGRTALTELGADAEAVRPRDRRALLFDIGIGAPHVDFCIRTDDPELTTVLRAAAGRSIAPGDGPAIRAIKAAAPHRVARCSCGRIEVYQRIGSRRAGVPTPLGPHTHLLTPDDPAARQAGPGCPMPDGWASALTLYPAHPLVDGHGQRQPFDADAHRSFQRILERFAAPGYMEEKALITAAVLAGMDPRRYPPPERPAARAAAIVTLRQLLHTRPDVGAVRDWLAVFEAGAARRRAAPPGH